MSVVVHANLEKKPVSVIIVLKVHVFNMHAIKCAVIT